MAAADVDTMPSTDKIFFCHECSQEVYPKMPEFTCSQCNSGFIEELENHSDEARADDTAGVDGGGGGGHNLGEYMEDWEHLTFEPPGFFGGGPDGNSGARVRTHTPPVGEPPGLRGLRARRMGPAGVGPHIMFQMGGGGPSAITVSSGGASGAASIDSFIQQVFNNLGVQGLQVMRPGVGGAPGGFNLGGSFGDYVWGQNGLDNIITQLLNQLENTGPPPADKSKIDSIPKHTTTQKDVDENADCAVCQSTYELGEEVKQLPCTHMFHIPCLDPWLVLHDSCPICRCNLEGEPPAQES